MIWEAPDCGTISISYWQKMSWISGSWRVSPKKISFWTQGSQKWGVKMLLKWHFHIYKTEWVSKKFCAKLQVWQIQVWAKISDLKIPSVKSFSPSQFVSPQSDPVPWCQATHSMSCYCQPVHNGNLGSQHWPLPIWKIKLRYMLINLSKLRYIQPHDTKY